MSPSDVRTPPSPDEFADAVDRIAALPRMLTAARPMSFEGTRFIFDDAEPRLLADRLRNRTGSAYMLSESERTFRLLAAAPLAATVGDISTAVPTGAQPVGTHALSENMLSS
jgi:hypothetical protein